MTVEEKREVVIAYCGDVLCESCKLNGERSGWCRTHSINTCDEEALNEALEIINPKPKEDVVNHPSHYTNGGMECIDEMILVFGEAIVADFCLCNVWKYRKRALHKNGQEDLDKADWYMNKYKELAIRMEKEKYVEFE